MRAGGQKNLVANTTIIDDGSIFFDNGNLNLAGFMLTTQGNASFIGTPSATSMIDFTNNGILRIASTSQAHLERVFPIGSYGEYLPVEFSSVTSTNYSGNFDIVTVSQPHPLLSGIDNALERYWNFRTDNINIESFSGAFSYSDNDININTTETDLNTVGYFLSEWNDTLQGISVDYVNNEILFSNTPNLIGTWTLGKAAGCFEAVSPKFTIANGNWNAVATWNDGIVPVDGESVIIYHNVRSTTTIPVTVGNLLIDAGGSLDIERLEFTVLGKTNIYGNITDSRNEGFNSFLDSLIIHPTGSFSTGNSSPHVFGGGILNNGTFSKTGTGTVSFVKGNQTLGGDNQILINGVVTINNLEVTNTGNVFLQNTDNSLTGSGSWIQAANSELYLWAGSLIDIAVFDAQAVNNTVYYNRLGAQAIREASTFYFNLELAGNNTKTFNGNINVLGNLDIYDVTVYIGNNADSRSHYIKGNIDINNGSLYTNNTNVIHSLSIGGNLIVNGNFDIYNNINRYATLSFVEDNPRTISGTPLGFDVYNLDFSNNSNTTTLDFDIQASNNFLYKRKHYYW